MHPCDINIANRKNIRGTAMMEFMLTLTPYFLVLMGAIFFWHLMSGKQTAISYAISESFSADGIENADTYFFSSSLGGRGDFKGVREFGNASGLESESSFNSLTGVRENVDEPVLPYADNGSDFEGAIVRNALSVTAVNSESGGTAIRVGLTAKGRRLKEKGIITNAPTGEYTVETLPEDLDLGVNQEFTQDAARIMGEWLSYRRAEASYSYSLSFGKEKLAFEENDPGDWRTTEITIGGGEKTAAYGVVCPDPDLRGTYGSVDLGSMSGSITGSSQGGVSPLTMNDYYDLSAIANDLNKYR